MTIERENQKWVMWAIGSVSPIVIIIFAFTGGSQLTKITDRLTNLEKMDTRITSLESQGQSLSFKVQELEDKVQELEDELRYQQKIDYGADKRAVQYPQGMPPDDAGTHYTPR